MPSEKNNNSANSSHKSYCLILRHWRDTGQFCKNSGCGLGMNLCTSQPLPGNSPAILCFIYFIHLPHFTCSVLYFISCLGNADLAWLSDTLQMVWLQSRGFIDVSQTQHPTQGNLLYGGNHAYMKARWKIMTHDCTFYKTQLWPWIVNLI